MKNVSQHIALLFAEATPTRDGQTLTGFKGTGYSGGVVPNFGFAGHMAVNLSSMQAPPAKVPFTFAHDDKDVEQTVGYGMVHNDGQSLTITDGRFSKATLAGKRIAELMDEGQPFMLSIGIKGDAKSVDRKRLTKVNGRDLSVDTVFEDARLLHISFVHSGADPNAFAARLSAQGGITPPQREESMDEATEQQLRARILELEGQNTALTTERDTARTELATQRTTARNAAITTLFGAEHGLTDVQLGVYRGMSEEQFAETSRIVLAARESSDGELFRQTAGAGRDHEGGGGKATFAAPVGYAVDPASAALHAKAIKYQAEHKDTDYLAAVAAVTA